MSQIKKGAVFYVNAYDGFKACGSECWPNRPAVIISNDIGNQNSNIVTVAYITTAKEARIPTQIKCKLRNKPSIIMCEQIFTVDKSRLGDYITDLDTKTIQDIDRALNIALNISTKDSKEVFTKWQFAMEKYKKRSSNERR